MPMTNFEDLTQAIATDPTASFWLKRAIRDAADRDPIDALHDARHLHAILAARWDELLDLHMNAPKV